MWVIDLNGVFFEGWQGEDNQILGTPSREFAKKFNTRGDAERFIVEMNLSAGATAVRF